MKQHKKILVMLLIATFLASIPISLAQTQPEITVVVDAIEIGTDYGKPPGTPGVKPDKPDKPDRTTGDYKLLGVKWSENLPATGLTLVLGAIPDENVYLTAEEIESVITASAEEWDYFAGKELVEKVEYATVDVDIFDEFADPDNLSPDYINELVFADLDQGVIAVCYTWSIGDQIVQFDIAFNTDYGWGDAETNPELMDLQNIATHELGHGFGLADLYKRKLSDLTMYGYASEGETIKRDLAQGDIDGIQALYGVPQ
jgi:hypothetical protein